MQKRWNGRILGGYQASMVTVYLIRNAYVWAMSCENVLQVGRTSSIPKYTLVEYTSLSFCRKTDCITSGHRDQF